MKTFEVAFRINAAMNPAAYAAFKSAEQAMKSLSQQAKLASVQMSAASASTAAKLNELNAAQKAVQKYHSLSQAVKDFSQRTAEAKNKSRDALTQYQQAQKQTDLMKQALERLIEVRKQEKSNMSREQYKLMGEQIKQARLELKAQQDVTKQLQQGYNQANATANRLNEQLRRQQQELNNLRSSFAQAGISAEQMSRHEASLQSQIQRTTESLERQRNLDRARQNRDQASQNLNNAFGNFQGSIDTAKSIMSPITDAIQNSMDFEFAMSNVKSLTQMNNIREGDFAKVNAEMTALTAQAEHLGATTEYTATQAAQLQGYLGMAGFDANAIQNMAGGILDLATATKTDLPRMADVVSDLMQSVGYTAGESIKIAGKEYEQSAHFMDVFAYATTRANLNTESLFEALKYSAPISKQFGLSMHEMAAANMVAANSGIKGSMAGTAMRTGLLRLVAPPKMAAKSLQEMGISASDATKQMQEAQQALTNMLGAETMNMTKNMSEGQKFTFLMEEMKKSFSGMDKDIMLGNLGAIFGKNAVSFWAEIFDNFDQYKSYLNQMDSGIGGWSADTAAVMRDNVKTQLEIFKSATDAAQRSLGNIFLPFAGDALKFGSEMAGSLKEFIDKHPEAVKAAGAIAAAISAITVAASGVALATAGFTFISAQFGVISAQATIAKTRILEFWAANNASSMANQAVSALQNLGRGFLNAAKSAMSFAFSPAGAALMVLGLAGYFAYQNWDKVAPIFESLAGVLGGTLQAAIASLTPSFSALGSTLERLGPTFNILAEYAFKFVAVLANVAVRGAATLITAFSNAVKTVTDLFSGLGGAFTDLFEGNFSGFADKLASTASKTVDNVKRALTQNFSNIGNIISTSIAMPSQVDAAMQSGSSSTSQIDTSQAQQQINDAGNAATQFSQSVQTATEVQNQTQQNQTSQNDSVNQFTQATTAANTELTTLQTNTNATSTEFTNLTSTMTATTSSVQGLDSSANSAGTSLGSLDGSVANVASSLNAKAAEISAIHISVPTVTTTPVAQNAEGGIYPKGAFLTTFAEKSPEAAIPIDKSQRAVDLWTQTGQLLGQIPGNAKLSTIDRARQNRVETVLKQAEKAKVKVNVPPQQVESKNIEEVSRQQVETKNIEEVSRQQVEEIDKQKRLEEAIKYLPQSKENQKVMQEVRGRKYTPLTEKVRRSRSGRALSNGQFINNNGQLRGSLIDNIPMTQTIPTQNNSGNILDKLQNVFNVDNKNTLGELTKNLFAESSTPPINISITIQGNADEKVMQTAGQQMQINLERELNKYFAEKNRNQQRGAFK